MIHETSKPVNPPSIYIQIDKIKYSALIDTGASGNYINRSTLAKNHLTKIKKKPTKKVTLCDSSTIEIDESVEI